MKKSAIVTGPSQGIGRAGAKRLAKRWIRTASPRNQSIRCGPPDTSVDLPTPTSDTDTARARALETRFLGRSQLAGLKHALASEHKQHL
jgi:NAD(P)-dependent dehydrogenase (short-subunit alcohol dehydrogenase family)